MTRIALALALSLGFAAPALAAPRAIGFGVNPVSGKGFTVREGRTTKAPKALRIVNGFGVSPKTGKGFTVQVVGK